MGLEDSGVTEAIASFSSGVSFGMLIIAVIYTSHYISKFNTLKKRMLQRK